MAKVTLNPTFESFSGHIGNIVYYERFKKMYARVYVNPHNPDTEKQRANRNLFRNAMNEWKLLSTEEKHRYNKRARRLPMTGHNLFISEYMKKHLADRGIEKSAAVTEGSQGGFISCSASTQKADPSVITPSLLLSGLYTASIPAGFDAG
mgnify:FL=1